MSDLTIFDFNETPVRVAILESGEPWWVAKDVCRALDLSNPSEALSGLDEDERNTLSITEGNRGNPNVNIISESGLYALIFNSRKPEARAFKRWVTREVLPAIRRTGGYSAPHLTSAEEKQVTSFIEKLEAVFDLRLNGGLDNGAASVLNMTASQILRAWDIKLRLRTPSRPAIEKGGAA